MFAHLFEAIARRGLASAISLTATSFLAHKFASSSLGTYVGMLAYGQLMAMVFSVGLELSPVYVLRNHPNQVHRIWVVATAVAVALACLCVVAGASISCLNNIGWIDISKLSEWGSAPYIYAATYVILLPQLACLQGILRLRLYNLLQICYPLLFLSTVASIDLLSSQLNPREAIYSWAAVNIVLSVTGAFLVLRSAPDKKESASASPTITSRSLFDFGLKSYAANIVGTLNSKLPNIVVAAAITSVASSHFSASVLLSDIFSFFSLAIASVTFPLLTGVKDRSKRLADLGRACRLNTSATLMTSVVFITLFDPLCRLLLGESFSTADFRLMALAVLLCTVCQSTARLLCTDFSAQGRPFLSALPNIPAVLVFMGAFWATVDLSQPWFAVLAYCLSTLCFSVLTFLLHRRQSGINFADIGFVTPRDIADAMAGLRRRWPKE